MRTFLILLAVGAAAVAAATLGGRTEPATAAIPGCAKASLNLVEDGQLSIGTDNPAYPPWFGGGEKTKPWKINDPNSGKGFESAVAYAVAQQLGFTRTQVRWVYSTFNRTIAPGRKPFDFAINQVSFTPDRAKALTFSRSYYNVNQSIVALNSNPLSKARSIAGLKRYKLGAQLGTTSYQYIVNRIKPSQSPSVYDSNDLAVAALKTKQIDGLVVDLPTAFFVTAAQVPGSKVVGQFPSPPGGEHFGMVFQRGNSLVNCVNRAIGNLKRTGALARIQQTWLAKVTKAPVLK
jgi:polar amino acid transport system substrate-binding protein